jgi:hypothetical protein
MMVPTGIVPSRCAAPAHQGPMRESTLRQNAIIMDIERVNAIGSLLADLSARTEQLRGYL